MHPIHRSTDRRHMDARSILSKKTFFSSPPVRTPLKCQFKSFACVSAIRCKLSSSSDRDEEPKSSAGVDLSFNLASDAALGGPSPIRKKGLRDPAYLAACCAESRQTLLCCPAMPVEIPDSTDCDKRAFALK